MSEWIKCSERLPDESRNEVLFYIKHMQQIEIGKYNEFTSQWMLPFRAHKVSAGNVTHWMPLPAAPEEE